MTRESTAAVTFSPYLCCRGAGEALAFYVRVFGATVREEIPMPDGRLGHAELDMGGARLMLADEFPEINFVSSGPGGTSVMMHIHVTDARALAARAEQAGARMLQPLHVDQGALRCKVQDPWGHVWMIESDVEPPATRDADAAGAELSHLWERLDLMTPMAIRTFATLRIADYMAAGCSPLEALAERAGADVTALGRLLRYLVVRGVLDEPAPQQFALNRVSALLLDAHPAASRRWLDLEGFGGTMDRAVFDLLATVRDGRPRQGGHKADLPEAVAASYDDVMEAQSVLQAPAVLDAVDWTGAHHVVDLGGGTGSLLTALLKRHGGMRGTLVELPVTAERARTRIAQAGLEARCAIVAGDLLEVMPRAADLYILKFVLHSLDDEVAIRALQRCRAELGPWGRVLIVERTLAPGGDPALFTSMDMLMLALGHGRERTLEEYSQLAASAGLRMHEAKPTAQGFHVMELRNG